jgi:hypothetical protein
MTFGLSQAEVAQNKKYYYHEANNVDDVVHVVSSFLSCVQDNKGSLIVYQEGNAGAPRRL